MADNGAIGWDDEVSESSVAKVEFSNDEFVVLPEGNYKFTVNKIERGQHNGSAKLPPCNMVKIGIIVDGGDAGRSFVYQRFYMHTIMLWKIYQFLTAIGLHKKGEGSGPIPWGKVTKGMTGMCTLTTRSYKGEDQNEVKAWLEPSEDLGDDY